MALDKIKLANKKARRERKRQAIRDDIARLRQHKKVQRKRTRAMFLQGQREFQAKRRADKDYVAALEAELADE